MNNIYDLSFIVVTHEFFKGTAQELKDFLVRQRAKRLLYVAHKFFYSSDKYSYFEEYSDGKLSGKGQSIAVKVGELSTYIKDLLYTVWSFFRCFGHYDYYIGSAAFNVLFGVLLRKIGMVDKVIFITIDYVMEKRFPSEILNKIYRQMDRVAFFGADYTWNVSERMAQQRILELGDKARKKVQITVPIGVPIAEAEKIEVSKKHYTVVYSGGLTPGFGLELSIESLPKLISLFPEIELRIIGKGPIENKLKLRVHELGVEKYVNIVGYIDTNEEREKWLKLIKESTLGLATYEETKETSYKRFSDVTKPKDYMSCGLPIIATSLIPLSEDIIKYNLGRVVEYNVDSLVRGISEIFGNEDERKRIQENVYRYGKNMTWENIFTQAFSKSVN